MNKLIGIILIVVVVALVKFGFNFKDEKAAGYLTKIRLYGTAILLFILAISFFITDKSFCELLPFFCRE